MRYLVVFMLLAALPARAQGVVQGVNPIDAQLDSCLASAAGQTTQGMVECVGAAAAAYDKRLNTVYVQALAALDLTSKEKLRDAQRAWLAFRRAEEQVYGGSWRDDRGTIMRVILAQTMLSALKERVQELEAYLPESQ